MMQLNLNLIAPSLRDRAVADLDAGDVIGFLGKAERGNQDHLAIVFDNFHALQARGLYEQALLAAWTSPRKNFAGWDIRVLSWMFRKANRVRLRANGHRLPGPGPFTLFRGVSGRGPKRRARGLSWTDDETRARWFAQRYASQFGNPAVYRIVVPARDVLAFLDDRQEREFVIFPPTKVTQHREWTAP